MGNGGGGAVVVVVVRIDVLVTHMGTGIGGKENTVSMRWLPLSVWCVHL